MRSRYRSKSENTVLQSMIRMWSISKDYGASATACAPEGAPTKQRKVYAWNTGEAVWL